MDIDARLMNSLGVELLLLFGSQARGDQRPDSDLDIGVVFSHGVETSFQHLGVVRDCLGGGDNIDLVCLNDADPLLLREAALDGVALFEFEPGTVEEFRIRAFKLFMDTAKFRKAEADSLTALFG